MLGDWLMADPSQIDFYVEKQEMMRDSWGKAFRNCQFDLGFKNHHEERYNRRNTALKLLNFFLLTVCVVGLVIIAVLLINRIRYTVMVPILAALTFVLMWLGRFIYYRKIGYYLFLANQRIGVYTERWPNIVYLIEHANGDEIPPEPNASIDEIAMKNFLADAVEHMMARRKAQDIADESFKKIAFESAKFIDESEDEAEDEAEVAPEDEAEDEAEPETETETKTEVAGEPENMAEAADDSKDATEAADDGMVVITVGAEDALDVVKIITESETGPEVVSEPEPAIASEPVPETATESATEPEPTLEPVAEAAPAPEPTVDIDNFDEIVAAVERQIQQSRDDLDSVETQLLLFKFLGP